MDAPVTFPDDRLTRGRQPADGGVNLLLDLIDDLKTRGFRRYRVDTLRHPDGTEIKHHFAGGEWTITAVWPAGISTTARYTREKPYPTKAELLAQVYHGHEMGEPVAG